MWFGVVGGSVGVVRVLMELGADVNVRVGGLQYTYLHFGARYGRSAVVVYLVEECGVAVDVKDEFGSPPLLWAVEKDQVGCVEELLRMGADVQWRDGGGWTYLHFAALAGAEGVVRYLLGDGRIDVDAVSKRGDSALMVASRSNHGGVVGILMGWYASKGRRVPGWGACVEEAAEIGSAAALGVLLEYVGEVVEEGGRAGVLLRALGKAKAGRSKRCVAVLEGAGA